MLALSSNTFEKSPDNTLYYYLSHKEDSIAKNQIIKEELIEVTWHPDRMKNWCLDIDTLDDIDKVFELMPGFNNIDINGKVIDGKNNDGTSDRQVSNSLEEFFYEHQFTANNLPQFSGYQIKVELISTNQAESPRLRDFRVIALA